MAAITPVSKNGCIGQHENGDPNIQLKCLKGYDDQAQKIYTCSTMRYFKVKCPKLNQLCSSLSGAWVAAITVCNQKLF